MRWHAQEIAEVARVNPRLAAADRPDLNDKVSFVPMASVSEESMSIVVHEERPFFEVSKGYTPFMRGDVLVAKITPCFENGKMALADNLPHDLGFGTTEFHVFRPSREGYRPLFVQHPARTVAAHCRSDEDERGCRVSAGFLPTLSLLYKSPFRLSPSRSELRGFWMRRTPCGPSAAKPSPSSTPSSNPSSSTCSATPSPIRWGGSKITLPIWYQNRGIH